MQTDKSQGLPDHLLPSLSDVYRTSMRQTFVRPAVFFSLTLLRAAGWVHTVRVAIYTRVSTEDQAKEGFSLEAQRERLEAYCLARDWSVAARYVDEDHSGRNIRRPAYQKMMAERDQWDALLVIKMDRIHRNSRNFMEKMEMTQKARVGPGILGFHPPLGYDVTEGRLVPIEAEAEVVREMFDLCLSGRTLEETAVELNANGHRTTLGTSWTPIKVYRILHNPVYAGFLRWDGIVRKADHDPLVAVEKFNEAQERLRARALLSTGYAPPIVLEA